MTVYEDKAALPFSTYQAFLRELKSSNPRMHDYLAKEGMVIASEAEYKDIVSKIVPVDGKTRHVWDACAKTFKFDQIARPDVTCSEMELLSNVVKKYGTVIYGGPGNGTLMNWMKENTQADVIGMDYSRGMMGVCRSGIMADCRTMPIQDSSVDQVFIVSLNGGRQILKEARRVLRPGGEVVEMSYTMFKMRAEDIISDTYEGYLDEFMRNENARKVFRIKTECMVEISPGFQDELEELVGNGFEESLKISEMPILPRGIKNSLAFHEYADGILTVSYALVGKKL